MPGVELAADGPRVSAIVFGTWRLLDGDPPPTSGDLAGLLDACLEVGIDTIDTAEIYGRYRVEEALGRVFRERPDLRERFTIVTKCGINVPAEAKPGTRVAHYDATASNVVACAEKSLRLMGIERIDVLLVHRPDWLTPADETAAGLERLLDSGKVGHVGVSNYTVDQFDLLGSRLRTPLVTNQVEVSLLAMEALWDGTLNQCERRRIRPMAWSPLAGGRLFGGEEAAVRVRAAMEAMRGRYDGVSDDALAFAWVMAHPSRPVPILGTGRADRIRSAARAAGVRLERQDWYALWEAARGRRIP